MHSVLIFFVLVGMCAVLVTFGFTMPLVAHTLASLFSLVVAEKTMAKARGVKSGTDMYDD